MASLRRLNSLTEAHTVQTVAVIHRPFDRLAGRIATALMLTNTCKK